MSAKVRVEMDGALRVWIGTILSGGIVAGFGAWDAVLNHSLTLSAAGDATFVLAGAGVIAGKAILDYGVALPTPGPPKP